MGKFKVSSMSPSGYDVAFGNNYFTFPGAPNPVAAAVAGMKAIIADNPGTLPVDLVKSMDDRGLQQGVIKQWTSLVKSGQASQPQARPQQRQQAPQQQFEAEPFQPQPGRTPDGSPLITRNEAMAFLQHRIEDLHKAEMSRSAGALQKTDKGYGGALPQLEGPAAINAMIKNLNTTFIRIHMMPAEIASAAAGAMAQGQAVPTAEEYFQSHPMYKSLARDVRKWLDEGGSVSEG